jgi:nitric oxide dioxygenase
LGEWLPTQRDVDAYFLGPKGFMGAIKRHLKALGVPEQQSRYEFFGPAAALE